MSKAILYEASEGDRPSNSELVRMAKEAGHYISTRNVWWELLDRAIPALSRPGLAELVSPEYRGTAVVCFKLDQLGHDAHDILTTVEHMKALKMKVICLQVHPRISLTENKGSLALNAIAGCADAIAARRSIQVRKGQARSIAAGGSVGRHIEMQEKDRKNILMLLECGYTPAQAAKDAGVDRWAVYRLIKREGIGTPS